MKTVALFLFLLLGTVPTHATSRTYKSLNALIDSSPVIAIVEVAAPDSPDFRYLNPDRLSKYRQLTSVKVLETLKGEVPQTISVLHMAELDDSLFQQGEGRYLVFLTPENNGYVPSDGWPSSKQIQGDSVIGWADGQSWKDKALLTTTLAYIKERLRSK